MERTECFNGMVNAQDLTYAATLNQLADILFDEHGVLRVSAERLKELVTAEEENRCKILPCAEGAFVFVLRQQRDNFSDELHPIICREFFQLGMLDKLGQTVFLTREEAEYATKNRVR